MKPAISKPVKNKLISPVGMRVTHAHLDDIFSIVRCAIFNRKLYFKHYNMLHRNKLTSLENLVLLQ